MTLKLGVLISGRGSNLHAIVQRCTLARVSIVISNVADAGGLEIAAKNGIPHVVVDPNDFANRAAYEAKLIDIFFHYEVDLIVLAGYMKLVGKTLISAFKNQIINIHPSLLPQFKGLDAQAQALKAGAPESGCTVHIVTPQMDDGPILGQRRVSIFPDDTVESLSARILTQEHQLLPEIIDGLATAYAQL